MSGKTSAFDHESLVAEIFATLPGETGDDSYERIHKIFCNYLDSDGSVDIAPLVQRISSGTDGRVILNAYMAACVRLNCSIRGEKSTLHVMMLPLVFRSNHLSDIPSEINQSTADNIQRIIEIEVAQTPRSNVLVIPSNRLLTISDFEAEQPRNLQKILRDVACALNNTKSRNKPNIFIMPQNETATDDVDLISDGRTVIAFRLMPFVIVRNDTSICLTSIGSRLRLDQLCHVLQIRSNARLETTGMSDTRLVVPEVQAYKLDHPFMAEDLIREKLNIERLYFDIAQFIGDAEPTQLMATIMHAPKVGILTVDMTKTLGSGNRQEAEFSMLLRHGYESYSCIRNLKDGLRALGVDLVTSEIIDNMTSSEVASYALH